MTALLECAKWVLFSLKCLQRPLHFETFHSPHYFPDLKRMIYLRNISNFYFVAKLELNNVLFDNPSAGRTNQFIVFFDSIYSSVRLYVIIWIHCIQRVIQWRRIRAVAILLHITTKDYSECTVKICDVILDAISSIYGFPIFLSASFWYSTYSAV